MLVHSFLIWRVRRHPEVKGLALGGMIAIICILVHCIVDFNLHIPANMLVFTIVLSLTIVTAFYKRNEATQTDKMSKASIVSRNMKNFRRTLLIVGVVVLIIVNIFIYWNQHLYYKAKRTEEIEKKINVLQKANKFYPVNDLVFYELGKDYFDLGIRSLEEDNVLGADYLRKSIQNFEASIRFNPASRFCHFYYAQSLLYMSYLFPSQDISSFEEYKKAALLAGHNSEIFYEVGKIFLSQWLNLANEEKEFTIESLKKIASGENEMRLQTLMHIWMMNVKDYAVMQEILPEDIQTYRMYAKFLGEMSLSLEERHKVLASAEYMEFKRAKSEYELGESEFMYLRVKKASKHFRSCLDILDRINFYQNLIDQKLINLSEYHELKKQAYLKLAKCHLREGRELNEVEGNLRLYFELEDSTANMAELESYLKDLSLISASLDDDLDDLGLLSFRILLYFKQNRYMDIVKVGDTLQKGYFFVPEYEKEKYVEVLRLIGDSYYRINYLYDAANFYNKALEVDPGSLEILLSLALIYERLSNDEELRKINEKIENILSQKEIDFENFLIKRGESFLQRVMFDGEKIILNLHLKSMEEEVNPWISVFLNGVVVWEDYTMTEVISIPLETKVGENTLRVVSGNASINLIDFEYKDEE